MPKVKIVTFGCQANELDSARIAGSLQREGYSLTDDEHEADVILLNGCSIREKAEQKLFSRLGTLQAVKAARPGVRLGVTGCLAQHRGESLLARFPYLDLVAGTGEHLAQIPALLSRAQGPAAATAEPTGVVEVPEVFRDNRFRAWVGIMEGCDHFCAFCVVPYTRGRERSRRPEDILREVADLRARGYREITLLGQTVNSYGKKLQPPVSFAALLRAVDGLAQGQMRVRFTTSHPDDVTPELARALAELPSACEHVHLPVQSGSSRVLSRMARGYTREGYLEKVAMLRAAEPDLALTTDWIVGFPGETEADFAETLSLLREVEFDASFAFKYSPRAGTPAAAMPDQIPEAEKAARLQQLLALQGEIGLQRNRKLIGKRAEVLVDRGLSKRDSGLAAGRTRQNRIVHFRGEAEEGSLVIVEITEANSHHLKGILSS